MNLLLLLASLSQAANPHHANLKLSIVSAPVAIKPAALSVSVIPTLPPGFLPKPPRLDDDGAGALIINPKGPAPVLPAAAAVIAEITIKPEFILDDFLPSAGRLGSLYDGAKGRRQPVAVP